MNQRILSLTISLAIVLLTGCATHIAHSAEPPKRVDVAGTVDKICAGCDTADLVNGGAVVWDVVSVRITSPGALAGGGVISVKVLLEGDGIAQRKIYQQSAHVAFSAAQAAIDARRVMLHVAEITSTD